MKAVFKFEVFPNSVENLNILISYLDDIFPYYVDTFVLSDNKKFIETDLIQWSEYDFILDLAKISKLINNLTLVCTVFEDDRRMEIWQYLFKSGRYYKQQATIIFPQFDQARLEEF